ncbi:hypothetical protein TNCT_724441 [Trichonephila clavata]|uniref:Uncharacterized protein n=1 Tax=Trichonephila clavata TaxID=2740835 RepID=A0A8X6L863_TRICU|nr:hypothetical protein TNCT_724441 [Trichonephila clavata]
MGKVFFSVFAARLSSWRSLTAVCPPFKKSLEIEGHVEHNFLLDQATVKAKSAPGPTSLSPGERLWLIPPPLSLNHCMLLGSELVSNIISSLYSGASSEIRCGAGWTPPIPMEAGVHQGFPQCHSF